MAADSEAAVSVGTLAVKEKITVFFGAIRAGTLDTIQLAAAKADSLLLLQLLGFLQRHLVLVSFRLLDSSASGGWTS
jgi:hypothetical protein